MRFADTWNCASRRQELRKEFGSGKPFPHVVLRPFLGAAGLKAVREELEKVDATEKETDLFRFFQTEDFAASLSRAATEEASPKKRRIEATSSSPLEAVARLFGSQDYRTLVQEITGCGDLSERVDLATQVYTKGSHLLCHDDVIGTRKVSFIYYMTDPDEEWSAEEGGALELFPSCTHAKGTPANIPSKELLPLSDSLAIFLVEPGVSFHAVREVRGGRARVSLQGWLHAPSLEQTLNFGQRELATLQQILETRAGTGAVGSSKVPEETLQDMGELSAEDWKVLSKWLAPSYCDPKQLKAVAAEFEEISYAVLAEFLRPDLAARLSAELEAVDAADGFEPDAEETVPRYDAGVCNGWELIGPPHLRRFLRYGHGEAPQSSAPHGRLGQTMAVLAKELFASDSFLRWLKACTGLDPRSRGRQQVRRFRPGMDYTVAAKAAAGTEDAEEAAELDAILTFALGDSSCGKMDEENLKSMASEQWASEEVGGFECYLAADEEEETVEAQEVYRGADTDGPLVNLPAVPNALCLVMRDSKTMRFLKYLSRDAPSSRVDISASYRVDPPEGSDEEEGAAA